MTGTPTPAAGQAWSAEGYVQHASFVSVLGHEVLSLLDPKPGEAVLDLGCGDGALAERITEAGARVTGLEPDPSMASAARARGLDLFEQDAHDPFGTAEYDAIFSNAALHWMREPERVLANAHAALRPGGRLVAEQGGFGNVAAVVTALHGALGSLGHTVPERGPWDFPRPEAQQARLEAAGFTVTSMVLVPRPTPLPTGIAGWLETFAAPYFAHLPQDAHALVLARTQALLTPLRDHEGGWWADYVRLRFVAEKPA